MIAGVRTSRVRSTVLPLYTVVTDTREQRPYPFRNAVTAKLDAGDYSILGLESVVAVERKNPGDLFGTVGAGRDRFERELVKLATYRYAAIVAETDLDEMFTRPPRHSSMSPKAVAASLIAWSIRHNVHVWFASSREHGFAVTSHILDKFWREHQQRQQGTNDND